ncbi:MAG: CD225/dispanin family protein [Myxococcales bacterium]|jgi:hypothetical protein|nr:CD225/dispanin family protein [Myxococcales bacterium]MBL9109361.1 CD225/dispanin family protein [Myxococcales bacterium]
MMVTDPTTANSTVHAAGGYGPPGGMPPGGGYGGPPPGGAPPGGYGGPPGGGGPPGFGGPPPGGYGGPPPGGAPPGGFGGPPPGGYGAPPPGFGPPGGGFPPPGGPMMPGAGGDVNTTLPIILGVISCLCCGISFILGVVGIVLAVQAGNAKNMGDIEGARSKAKTATILGAVGIGLGLLLDVVWGIINVAANS